MRVIVDIVVIVVTATTAEKPGFAAREIHDHHQSEEQDFETAHGLSWVWLCLCQQMYSSQRGSEEKCMTASDDTGVYIETSCIRSARIPDVYFWKIS